MQRITGTVGEGGANAISDVALVQAMLIKVRRPSTTGAPAGSYLARYDGGCGPATTAAIRAFQAEHVFAPTASATPDADATAGLVSPDDATWRALVERMPAAFADLRVLPGSSTVYVAATAAELRDRMNAANRKTFALPFRIRVLRCLQRMHAVHGIALGVCARGDRRDFQTQYDRLVSGGGGSAAGPGESKHNFGLAVDLGFEGLRWLRRDGSVVGNETSWLHRLDPQQTATGQALFFWNTLRAIATSIEVGCWPGPHLDRPHLQSWNDIGTDMAARLADLLTRSGTMRWAGQGQRYRCDLGLGGELVAVGSARQIWSRQATITIEKLDRLRAAHAARGAGGGAAARRRRGGPARATPADVAAMRQRLREQFELADANWQSWTAG